jgi:hypothetical protein
MLFIVDASVGVAMFMCSFSDIYCNPSWIWSSKD